MTAIAEATAPYALDAEQGVTDLWWPYGPAVGRYIVKAAAEQTGGRMVQMVVRDSRGAGTPLHTHLDADESRPVSATSGSKPAPATTSSRRWASRTPSASSPRTPSCS